MSKSTSNISRVKLSNLLSDKRDGTSVREFIRKNKEFDIAPHAWRAWESGETKPNSDNLIKLSNLFGISLEEFISLIEEKEGEVVEFKNPVRPYVRKKEVSKASRSHEQTQLSIPVSVLSDKEIEQITTRLLLTSQNKTELLFKLLKDNPGLLTNIFDSISEFKTEDALSFLKSLLNQVGLKKEEKITLAAFLLNEAAGIEQV